MISYEKKTHGIETLFTILSTFFHSVPKCAKISRFREICKEMQRNEAILATVSANHQQNGARARAHTLG